MEPWMKISLLLCIFGFIKELRPSEPFTYEFLINWKNLTENQILKQAFPVSSYTNLFWLVVAFLITDIGRYKPILIVLGLSGMAVWSLMLWTNSLPALILIEAIYGLFQAAEVAYFSYIYAKVDRKHFQKVSSHTRGAKLAGRCISGVTSQLLTSTKLVDYKQLNYFSLGSITVATIWALFLPSVNQSLYFYSEITKNQKKLTKTKSAFKLMKTHFLTAYTNISVLKWSIWFSLSYCGYTQVEFYLQPLYFTINKDNPNNGIYNGAVEAIVTLTGFLSVLLAGYLKISWEQHGDLALGFFSIIQGALIVTISQTANLVLCYIFYIFFGLLFWFVITFASSEIARQIDEDSYGLIFGVNTFVAAIFNAILTATVATEGVGFGLDPRGQYIVYGGYHLGIAAIFGVIGLRRYFFEKRDSVESQN